MPAKLVYPSYGLHQHGIRPDAVEIANALCPHGDPSLFSQDTSVSVTVIL